MPSPSTLTQNPSIAWQTFTADQVVEQLNSDRSQGLSHQQVEENLKAYGSNELVETGGRSSWDILIDQFKNVMLLMLIAVAVISAALDIHQAQLSENLFSPRMRLLSSPWYC